MYHAVTRDRPAASDQGEDAPSSATDEEQGSDRKERVLHTRVPAVLEKELKRFADSLRVPVSNLVRTILEDALAVADRATGRVEAELQAAAKAASEQRQTLRTKLRPRSILDEVFAFQPVVLAQATRCSACGVELERGADAWLGMRDTPGPRVIACGSCVPRAADDQQTEPSKGEES